MGPHEAMWAYSVSSYCHDLSVILFLSLPTSSSFVLLKLVLGFLFYIVLEGSQSLFCMAKEAFPIVCLIHFHFLSLICTATCFPCACLHSVYNLGHTVNIMKLVSMQFSTVFCYAFSSRLSLVAQNFVLEHLQLCFHQSVWNQVRYPCNATGKIISLPYETVPPFEASLLKQK